MNRVFVYVLLANELVEDTEMLDAMLPGVALRNLENIAAGENMTVIASTVVETHRKPAVTEMDPETGMNKSVPKEYSDGEIDHWWFRFEAEVVPR